MKVKIKRIDKSIPLPSYQTKGAVCFDISARKKTIINPGEIKLIPSNIIVKVPRGYMLLIAPRSSTPRKFGLLSPHGIGIIDQDYCGPRDEIMFQVYNFKKEPVTIKKGERIAQAVFVKIEKGDWEEIEKIKEKTRGGFGSTG
jgi:dUTP pyrophosphatase